MGISRAPLGGAKLPRLITEETALAGTDGMQRMFSALRARQAARYAVDVVDARAGLPVADSEGADDGKVAIRNDGLYTIEVTPHHGTGSDGLLGSIQRHKFSRGALKVCNSDVAAGRRDVLQHFGTDVVPRHCRGRLSRAVDSCRGSGELDWALRFARGSIGSCRR